MSEEETIRDDVTIVHSIKDSVIKTIFDIDQKVKKINRIYKSDDDLKTDFRILGFHKDELCILSSKPGMGKSAFVLSLIKQLAVEKKQPVGLISPGNFDDETLGQRLISICSGVDTCRVETGMMNGADLSSVQEAAGKVYGSPIEYYREPNCSYENAKKAIKIMVEKYHVRLVVVEDFEFLRELVDAEKQDYRKTLEGLLNQFKSLAWELIVPIMLVVDLPENNSDPFALPTLFDFKKYMFIPYIADKVIFVHRDPEQDTVINDAKLFIAKNNYDMPSLIPIKFDIRTSLFFEEK